MQVNLKTLGLAVFCIAVIGYKCSTSVGDITLGPGVMAPEPPLQTAPHDRHPFPHRGYVLEPLADFQMKAKVLSRKDYRLSHDSDLIPTDLMLGWGNMSDEAITKSFKFSQGNRRGYLSWQSSLPISKGEVELSYGNMHIIPSTEHIADSLARVRNGDIVEISGKLVRATRTSDGWSVTSSLSRKDRGDGACELIWVESLSIPSA